MCKGFDASDRERCAGRRVLTGSNSFHANDFDRSFVGVSHSDRSEFFVDVDANPDAVSNLVFPETQNPVTTVLGDGSSLHGTTNCAPHIAFLWCRDRQLVA